MLGLFLTRSQSVRPKKKRRKKGKGKKRKKEGVQVRNIVLMFNNTLSKILSCIFGGVIKIRCSVKPSKQCKNKVLSRRRLWRLTMFLGAAQKPWSSSKPCTKRRCSWPTLPLAPWPSTPAATARVTPAGLSCSSTRSRQRRTSSVRHRNLFDDGGGRGGPSVSTFRLGYGRYAKFCKVL